MTPRIRTLTDAFDSEPPGVKTALARLLTAGAAGGSGRLLIYGATRGATEGPDRAYGDKSAARDPHFHFRLAEKAAVSAYMAPLGLLEAGAGAFAGSVPLILSLTTPAPLQSDRLAPEAPVTATIRDALRLGCSAVAFDLFPGSDREKGQMEKFREIVREARLAGVAVMACCRPRGGYLSHNGETALDTLAVAVHSAAAAGAHLIEVPLPLRHVEQPALKKIFREKLDLFQDPVARLRHLRCSAFEGRRLLTFRTDDSAEEDGLLETARHIRAADVHGCHVEGLFHHKKEKDSVALAERMADIFHGRENLPTGTLPPGLQGDGFA